MVPATVRTDKEGVTRTSVRLSAAAAIIAVGLMAVAGATLAQGPVLTRGPYLQLGTATSVVVRWRTATPGASVVRYGLAPGQLTATATAASAGATTEHVVTLTGLSAHTRYYYAVGDGVSEVAGGDLAHTFVTAPVRGARTPTRLWVLGDSGTADANARAVRDAYLAADRARGTDLWLMLGDNAYTTGTDAQYQQAVFAMYPEVLRQAVLWPTFGNHDAISADSATQTGPYYDVFTLPAHGEAGGVPSGTEAYYSFDYGNIHVVCLDSTESNRSPSGPMLTWLVQDLAASRAAGTADWTIAFFHHAPYSKGSHDSDTETELVEMRQYAVPILEAGGVDLVLSGHSHSYERTALLSGHTGVSPTLTSAMVLDGSPGDPRADGGYRKVAGGRGTVYVTAGSSGMVSGGPLDHPAMRRSLNVLGSLVVEVDGPRLAVRFLSSLGAVQDEVLLTAHEAGGVPGAPGSPGNGRQGPLELSWLPADGGGAPLGYVLEAGTRPGASDLGTAAAGRGTTPAFGPFPWPLGPGRFYLRTRAVNAAGTGPASGDLELQVDTAGAVARSVAPTLSADVSGTTVTVTAGPATSGGVVLEAGTAAGRRDLGELPMAGTSLRLPDVPPGVYFLRARVAVGAGLAAVSPDVQVVVGGVPAPPGVPVALRPSVAGRAVTFAWAPPPDGAAPLHYVVEAGLEPQTFTLGRLVTGSARPGLTLADVPPGTYYVRVRGANVHGEGLPSLPARVVVP